MPPSDPFEITVLGAGVSGLTVALCLAQQGYAVTVLERAEAISEVGAGLQISPNGARVLFALGLGPALDAITLRASAVHLRDGFDGRSILRMTLPGADTSRAPATGWAGPDHASDMDTAAYATPPDFAPPDYAIAGDSQLQDPATNALSNADYAADYGADDASDYDPEHGADYGPDYGSDYATDDSAEYGTEYGPQPGFHLTHRADLIRLLADAARAAGVQIQLLQHVSSVEIERDGTPLLRMMTGAQQRCDLLIGADGLNSPTRRAIQTRTAAQPFFTGQVAWRMTVPCDPDTPHEAQVYMGPGRHLVSYPLRDGTLRNIVAVEERVGWTEEGWHLKDEPTRVQRAFSGFAPEVRAWLSEAREVYLWGLFRHEVAETWHRGQAVILGDAAHPTLPFLAQGANMALEDAWVLARSLATHHDLESALSTYQARRIDRVRKVVAAANGNAKAYHMRPGPLRSIAHTALGLANRYSPDLMLKRFAWLYDKDVTRD